MAEGLTQYLESGNYLPHITAARIVWSLPELLEVGGLAVLLTYLSIPTLVGVQPQRHRGPLDGIREKAFMMRLVGLDGSRPGGGIADPNVRAECRLLLRGHATYTGMTQEYIDFVAATIALAPKWYADTYGCAERSADWVGHWAYMTHAMRLFDCELGTCDEEVDRVERFATSHCRISAETIPMIGRLRERHNDHFHKSLPMLIAPVRSVIMQSTA